MPAVNDVGAWLARRPRWHQRTTCEGAGGSPSAWRTAPGAKAAYPTTAPSALMSRVESIGMTRSQGRPASLVKRPHAGQTSSRPPEYEAVSSGL